MSKQSLTVLILAAAFLVFVGFSVGTMSSKRAPEERVFIDEGPVVIYEEDAVPQGNPTRIIKVERVLEDDGQLLLEVQYYNDGRRDGYINLGVYPDIPGWYVTNNRADVGLHSASVKIGLNSKARAAGEVQKSTTLGLRMEHVVNNKWQSYVYQKIIPYQKSWYP